MRRVPGAVANPGGAGNTLPPLWLDCARGPVVCWHAFAGLGCCAPAGPMIIAGDAEGSNLLVLMEGRADPSISMPHGEQKSVAKQDIQTIRLWIEQGAKWPEGVTLTETE